MGQDKHLTSSFLFSLPSQKPPPKEAEIARFVWASWRESFLLFGTIKYCSAFGLITKFWFDLCYCGINFWSVLCQYFLFSRFEDCDANFISWFRSMDCFVRVQTLNCSIVEKVHLIYVWQVVLALEFIVKCISLLVILKDTPVILVVNNGF